MSKARSRTKKKPSPAVCRCCLGNIPDGFIKDISAPYFYDGQQEVYADMLKDTFDVEISFQEGCGPSRHSRLICDDCVLKLRDASLFKQKVLDSEENILQHLESLKNGIDSTDLEDSHTSHQTKCNPAAKVRKPQREQSAKEESDSDEANDNLDNTEPDMSVEHDDETNVLTDVERCEVNDRSEDDAYHFEEVEAIEVEELDDEFLASVKVEVPDSEPEDSPRETRAKKRAALDAAAVRAKRVKVELDDDDDDDDIVVAKDPIVPDCTLILLENSNICPFEYNLGSNIEPLLKTYRCFLCAFTFHGVKELREHFEENHEASELMTKVLQSKLDEPINVDISNLKCKLCEEKIDNINELTAHLSEQHNLEFGHNSVHNLMPYKLIGRMFRCQFCDGLCQDFFSLYKHMTKHRRQTLRKKVVCEQCGKVFTSYDPDAKLDNHMLAVHGTSKPKKTRIKAIGSKEKIANSIKIIVNSNICPVSWPKEKNYKLKCFSCTENFTDVQQLREHFESNHDRNKLSLSCLDVIKVDITNLRCTQCHAECVDLLGLKSHLMTDHDVQFEPVNDVLFPLLIGDGYKCVSCDQDFKRWFFLNRHIRSDHFPLENQQLVCADCGMEFPSKKTIKYHIKKVHSEPKKLVHRSIALRDNTVTLMQHSNMWLFRCENLLYKCFTCDFKTLSVDVLKDHCLNTDCRSLSTIKDHLKATVPYKINHAKAEITDLSCKICNEPFEYVESLKKHLKETHDVFFHSHVDHYLMPYHIMDGFKCGFCKEKFSVVQTMTRHINLHVSKEVCDYCGSLFVNNNSLRHHIKRQHAPIKCNICDITFDSFSDRRVHNKQHKEQRKKRNVKCLFCEERFTYMETKMRHMKLEHDFNAPEYKCNVCNRLYYTRGAFTNHVASHSRVSSPKIHCRFCDFICYVKFRLDEHVQIYHKDEGAGKYYKCTVCSELFVSADLLKSHIVNHSKGLGSNLCVYCGKEFKSRKSLTRHLVKKHDIVDKDGDE